MLSGEIKQQALDLYRNGLPKSVIARRLGISRDSVAKICCGIEGTGDRIANTTNDIVQIPSNTAVKDPLAALIFRELEQGESLSEIIIKHDLNPDLVKVYFSKFQEMTGLTGTSLEELRGDIQKIYKLLEFFAKNLPLISKPRISDHICEWCNQKGSYALNVQCQGCGKQMVWW